MSNGEIGLSREMSQAVLVRLLVDAEIFWEMTAEKVDSHNMVIGIIRDMIGKDPERMRLLYNEVARTILNVTSIKG